MRQFRAFLTYLSMVAALLWVTPSRADDPPKVLRIWTVGDSTAQPIGHGVERNVNDTTTKKAKTFYRNSSGLARREFYDWPKVAKKLLESEGAPDIAIITLGANDTQGLFPPGKKMPVMLRTQEWKDEYARRLEVFLHLFTDKNVHVYLVAQPYNPNRKYAPTMGDVNEVIRTVATRMANVSLVDAPTLLADENGNYSNAAKDSQGRKIWLRAEDGLHLTGNGGAYLARRILAAIETDQAALASSAGGARARAGD
jgi:hypothetical protein